MKQPDAILRNEEAGWSRRSALSRWQTRFGLHWQWALAALPWGVIAVAAYSVDLAVRARESPLVDMVLFGMWLVPGAAMVTAIAARNTWVRLVHPERFARDQARARYPEVGHPAALSPALRRKMTADWDFRSTREY